MIFIFDWGYNTTHNVGPLSEDDAEINLDAEYVFLVEQKTWFRMFFIPIIVTSRSYFFKDAESDKTEDISKEIFQKYRKLAQLNAQIMNDEISESEYEKKRSGL